MNFISTAYAADSGIIKGLDAIIPGGLGNILNFGLMIGGAIALGTIIYGGIIYAMSGDNSSKQKEAKEWILAAVKGLAILTFGYALITVVNPQLITVKEIIIPELERPEIIQSNWDSLPAAEKSTYQFGSSHFSVAEFRCRANGELPPQGILESDKARVLKACGKIPTSIDPLLLQKLDELRAKLGNRSIEIVSGYRTPAYNDTLSGSADLSQHMCGRAADIHVQGVKPADVAKAAESIFVTGGIGRYATFTHVDVRPNGPSRW